MMIPWGNAHLYYLVVTAIFLIVGCVVCRFSKRWLQNVIFVVIALTCSCGIFFRYAMSLQFSFKNLQLVTLLEQLLQVCNFNFILLPLCLIRKNELARQYALYFSMFGAATVYVSYSSNLYKASWNDITFINFWINHTCAVALPLFMVAGRRLKPQKKYILPVIASMVGFFFIAFIGSWYLLNYKNYPINRTFSFIYDTYGIPLLDKLYQLIPYPMLYLTPLLLLIIPSYYLLAWVFRKYKLNNKLTKDNV